MTVLNWDLILHELEEQPWLEEDGELVRKVFIGRTMRLAPSGKEYSPLLEENLHACDRCKNLETPCTPEDPCCAKNKLDGDTYHCDLCRDRTFEQLFLVEASERNLDIIYKLHNCHIIFVGERKPLPQKE